MTDPKEQFINDLAEVTELPADTFEGIIEVPQNPDWGDLALPCFHLARSLRKDPKSIAAELGEKLIATGRYASVTPVNAYLNVALDRTAVIRNVMTAIMEQGGTYGRSGEGEGKTVVVEYSSPNIAKPFSIGHLRSTIIGNSLRLLYEAMGYRVVGVNHLGDWGTQFGKLICAFRKWGNDDELTADPIKYLLKLYVRFHEEAEKDAAFDDEARAWFKKLEDGDEEATGLWNHFREISLVEFNKVYRILGVSFDSYDGEAFYNTMLADVRNKVKDKVGAVVSEGALIVDLEDADMPPLMLAKSDGASTYANRDLAAALHRIKQYAPEKIIYAVGHEQQLHFKQVFEVLRRMGHPVEMFRHVNFGLISFPGGKMSTRKGNVILLEEVIDRAVSEVARIIEEKNADLTDRDAIAAQVGISALIFSDFCSRRHKNVTFNWDAMLNFNGETGPYVQYTHARLCSILRKHGTEVREDIDFSLLSDDSAYTLGKRLMQLPDRVKTAAEQYEPAVIAAYTIDVCSAVNAFYNKCHVLSDNMAEREARVALVDCSRRVIRICLELMGMQAPEEM